MSWQNVALSLTLRTLVKRHRTRFDISAIRARLEKRADRIHPAGVKIDAATMGGVPGEWVIPYQVPYQADAAPWTMLYLHGGAYLVCSPRTHRPMTAEFARRLGAKLFVPDYRLAPEHPFPAAVADAYAVYRALLDTGIDPQRLLIAGDSAGGGLSLATLLAAKRDRLPLPRAAILLSPWTDLTGSGPSVVENRMRDPFLSAVALPAAARLYYGAADPRDPLVSPLFADLSGLPPLFVLASTTEIVRDDSTRLVDRVKAAGGQATLDLFAGQVHVWPFFHRFLPEARAAFDAIAGFVRGL